MAEHDQSNTGAEGAAPPKQVPFKPIQKPPAADDVPDSAIRRPVLRRPGESAAPSPRITTRVDVPSLRKTTRVDVPPHVLADAEDDEFKTVKLRPTPPPAPGGAPLPTGPKPPTPAQQQAAKSKTTRITLEAAYAGDDSAPKTIRLKRPSEMKSATAPIAVPVATAKRATGAVPSISIAQHSQTARLPTQQLDQHIQPIGDEEGSPTRRKTIKIKRPTAPSGVKITIGGKGAADTDTDSGATVPPLAERQPVMALAPDSAHWTFIAASIVAMLLTIGVIWILAAQAFGPNAAVTGYSQRWGADIAPPPGLVIID